MLDSSSTGSKRHSLAVRGHDLYETPEVATLAVTHVERLPLRLWEPAAGRGAIVRPLRAAGHLVVASDLIDYGGEPFTPPGYLGRDFLKETKAPAGTEAIVTNPPYHLAEAFVRHALKLSPLTIMLLRLAFLESVRRSDILEGAGLARVHVFRKRLPMMHRDQWKGPRASSGIAFAWFVWDRQHTGPTTLHRVSWHDGHGSVREAATAHDQAG